MQSGRQQIGPYRIINLIGRGGMGEVYLAEDPRIQHQVAIKIMQTEATAYPSGTAAKRASRLQREAKAIAQLNHPGIVRLYGYDEETSNGVTSPYIVMEYYGEGSFAEWLRKRPEPPSLQDIAYFIGQAADALQYAHNSGIIHQDVKPSNFLIRTSKDQPSRPNLSLTDFGVARFASADASTIATAPMATLTYMAPEQLEGNTQPLPATDQYALAIMAYELLTGRPPFQGPPAVVMRQHLNDHPQPPSMLNTGLPRAIDNVILHALTKRPEDRYSSISEFARAFQQAVQSQSGNLRPPVQAQSANVPPPVQAQSGNDIRETIRISPAEAYRGTSRALTLPGGRQVTVSVPANAYNGQLIRLAGQGEPSRSGGPAGNLLVTINITAPQASPPPPPGPAKVYAPPPQPAYPGGNVPPPVYPNVNTPRPPPVYPGVYAPQPQLPVSISSKKGNRGLIIIVGGIVAAVVVLALIVYAASLYATTANYPFSNTLALDDSLSSQTSSNWFGGQTNGAACGFSNGAYHASLSTAGILGCPALNTNFSNFTYEVQMQIISGECGGIMFRGNAQANTFYYVAICSSGQYGLCRYAGGSTCTQPLTSVESLPNFSGNQLNTIAVVARGSQLDLYVNRQHIGGATNKSFSAGQIGVVAVASSAQTQVVFSNAKVWTL